MKARFNLAFLPSSLSPFLPSPLKMLKYVCVDELSMCVYVCAITSRSQKRAPDSQELESDVIVAWELELGFSVKAISALKC